LAQSLYAEGFAMDSKFSIGDKVDQAFSNHAEGTVVAVFTDRAVSPGTPSKCSVTARYRSQAKAV
jgi:hypothetical protein